MSPTKLSMEQDSSTSLSSTDMEASQSVQKELEGDNALSKTSTEPEYPPTSKVIVLVSGIYLTAFLIALDRLIVGVAVPSITDEFHSLGDVGWYGSAYLLASCSFMLLMGRIYTLTNPKWVYLTSLVVFEIGSAVCGSAPNSKVLIIGRAIAGLGSAALFQGAIILIVYLVPLHKRPQYMGIGGMVFGIASATGPLLGGAFTDGPGWRWCFYINLPCGAAVFVLLVLYLHIPPSMLQGRESTNFKQKLAKLDPFGTAVFLPCIVCLLLALQWGGVTYAWSDARIIILLVLSGVLAIIFIGIQIWKGPTATIPGHIIGNRSVAAGTWISLCNGAALQVMVYFLPIWFQAIKNASAIHSGVMNLPMVLSIVVASVSSGILTRRIGYYTQWLYLSVILIPVGAGLTSTFTPTTNHSKWIAYQVLFGLGFGLGGQQTSVAAQTVLARNDVPIGASLMQFSQTLGGAVFVSVGNNLLDSHLSRDLARIPGVDVGSVIATGATDLRQMIAPDQISEVLIAYNNALRTTFYLAAAMASIAVFGTVAMEWKSVKKNIQPKQQPQEQRKEHMSGNDDEAREKASEQV